MPAVPGSNPHLLFLHQVMQGQLCGAVQDAGQADNVWEYFLQRDHTGHQPAPSISLPVFLYHSWRSMGGGLLRATLGLGDGTDLGESAGRGFWGRGVEEAVGGQAWEGGGGAMDGGEGARASGPQPRCWTTHHGSRSRLVRRIQLPVTRHGVRRLGGRTPSEAVCHAGIRPGHCRASEWQIHGGHVDLLHPAVCQPLPNRAEQICSALCFFHWHIWCLTPCIAASFRSVPFILTTLYCCGQAAVVGFCRSTQDFGDKRFARLALALGWFGLG